MDLAKGLTVAQAAVLFSAFESGSAGFDGISNLAIAAFGMRNAILTGEWEDAHGNPRVCAFSRLEAAPAPFISRQSVRFHDWTTSQAMGRTAESGLIRPRCEHNRPAS